LLLRVEDVMVSGAACPQCPDTATLTQALVEITSKGLGMVVLTDQEGRLSGIFTDGDLRRTVERDIDIRKLVIATAMTPKPATIASDALAINAVTRMQELRITSLPVVAGSTLQGVVTMHGLLAAGVV
jgi:arabinose-5-phosphate isomerase